MNLNKVFVLGNLTRNPEVRSLPSGQQIATFCVATNRFYTDNLGEKKQETEFHNIVCFGKLADISSRYLTKGSLVLIEGRIRTRNWLNSQGIKQYRTEIIAEAMQLGPKEIGSKSINEQPPQEITLADDTIPVIEESYPPPPQEIENQEEEKTTHKNEDEIDVKDIPF